jgi:hypothetical protein
MPSENLQKRNEEHAMALNVLERAVEMASGVSAQKLRDNSLEDIRLLAEKRKGSVLAFSSYFPVIGRGNVMRDRIVSHAQVETDLDLALSGDPS